MAEELEYAKPGTPAFVPVFKLVRQDVGPGCRWTLPSDGEPVRRASRIVSTCAAILFATGVGVLFAVQWLGPEVVVRALSAMWITAIILALAAAHWRHIAGEPIVLEVQPELITLRNPQQLWGGNKRWNPRRVRSIRILPSALSLSDRAPEGVLYLYTWLMPHPVFTGLTMAELQQVAQRMAGVTGIRLIEPKLPL